MIVVRFVVSVVAVVACFVWVLRDSQKPDPWAAMAIAVHEFSDDCRVIWKMTRQRILRLLRKWKNR